MTEITTSWICLFSPLVAVVAIALGGNRFSRRAAGLIATGSVGLSFTAAVVAFATMLTRAPHDRSHVSTAWTWLSAGILHFGLSVLIDPLSVFMMLVRLVWICGKTFARHATIWLMVGSTTHGLRSFAPMSMVTSWTWPLWLARKAAAWASWLPAE